MRKKTKKDVAGTPRLYDRIQEILEAARANVVRSVNTTQEYPQLRDWAEIGYALRIEFDKSPGLPQLVIRNAPRAKSETASRNSMCPALFKGE